VSLTCTVDSLFSNTNRKYANRKCLSGFYAENNLTTNHKSHS